MMVGWPDRCGLGVRGTTRGLGGKRLRTRVMVCLAVMAVTLLAAGAVASGAETFLTEQLTTDEYSQYSLDLSGDRVVWSGGGGSDGGSDAEVFTWTPEGGVEQLTANSDTDLGSKVSGDRVAWWGSEIRTWTPTGGVVEIATPTSYGDRDVVVSGDRLAWRAQWGTDNGLDTEIFTWTPDDGVVQLTADSVEDFWLELSDDRLVWGAEGGTDGGSDHEVFTWTPEDGVVQLTTNAWDDTYPNVSGDRVVWRGKGGTDGGLDTEIFTWTPDDGVVQLTTDDLLDSMADVSGDRVVWSSSVGGFDNSVFTWTPTGGVVQLSADSADSFWPIVSGNRVIWFGYGGSDGGADTEVFAWAPGEGVTQVTVDTEWVSELAVSSGRLGWTSSGGSDEGVDTEVFTATVAPRPTVTGIDPASGPTAGGNTVSITGTGFVGMTDPSAVTFDGVPATNYNVTDENTLTAVAPAHVAGTVTVRVMAESGASVQTDNYTYVDAPVIAAISPDSGYSSGGIEVVISGTGLTGATAVTFGGLPATAYAVESDTCIRATTPAHAVGSVQVRVTTCAGGQSSEDVRFTFVERPLTRYQQTDGRIYYTGAWRTSGYYRYSGGNEKYTRGRGASVYIPFEGTRLDWIAKTSRYMGYAKVSVDGGEAVLVNLCTASTEYRKKVYSTGELPEGLHYVKITRTGTPGWGGGTAITIDAVDVAGKLAWSNRYQENDAKLYYQSASSGWKTTWCTSFSFGKQKYANAPGNSVTLRFDGVACNIIATKARSYGKVWVSVDGGTPRLVDLYSYRARYKQTVFATGYLTPGEHTVTITWSGQKNPYSRGYSVNIDAVDIVGTLIPSTT